MLAGLSGPTGGRLFGFGADQILQIEMVLASGDHVLFGPVDWDEVEGKSRSLRLKRLEDCAQGRWRVD